MSNYDDRLKTLREEACETQELLQDLAADAWPSTATRSRTLGVFAYARTILETTDPELLSDLAFQQVSTSLAQFKANPAAGPTNADPWTSTVLDAIAQLPAARDREVEQSVKDAAANFQRSAQQRLNALKDEYAGTKSELQGLKTEIEQRREELSTAIEESKTEILTEIASLEAAFAQKLVQYEQQLANEQTALSKLRTTQTSEFEASEALRAAAAKERLEAAAVELDRIETEARDEVGRRVAEIRRMENESAQLVGAIGLAGTAERYGEEVKDQKKISDVWRLTTVGLALLAVAAARYTRPANAIQSPRPSRASSRCP